MPDSATHAHRLGEYVVETSLDDFDEETLTHARHLLLDSIGVTVGGTELPQGERMIEHWRDMQGTAEATVPSSEEQWPTPVASYLNSYLANLLDYDDTYSGRAIGHPGATVVPPAIAVAEREGATGRELLRSILVGYEVSIRIGDAIMPSPDRSRKVVSTATWQLFGATAATAALLKLDAETTATAFGLAGVSAPVPAVRKVGIEDDELHDLKNNYGLASMAGVKAALLADRGFEGNTTIFDGSKGFWRMAGSDEFQPSILSEGISDGPALLDVAFKPYSSCRWSHAALDCVSDLKADVYPDDVERVTINTFHEAATLDSFPESVVDAQFSLPYVVAVHLLDYPTGYGWLQENLLTDPTVESLADRVKLVEDVEMTTDYEGTGQMRAEVEVETAEGTTMTSAVDHPSGGPGNPIPYEDVEAKFDTLVSPIVGEESMAELRQQLLDIESVADVSSVGGLLR